ncbi:hypothetical protein SAMN04487775_10794 [Treponema bryantii]|uniref:Lipoprotein n=1 Tax=Treponema bryantii TaxID=163 RepID=A0A1I3LNB2_9SPIR|nr:hypothetical protein [Treponema bryantii]SFI86187.1 hypothetical protein SAMN04487775_10794 [Treponema bryantii]
MRKICSCGLLLLVIILLFSSCKGKDTKYSSVYEKQQATYIEQLEEASIPKNANKTGTIILVIIGIVIGGIIGYFVWASPFGDFVVDIALESPLPAVFFYSLHFLVFISLGGFLGFKISNLFFRSISNEYINVETSFVFSQHDGEEIRTLIYGTSANEDANKHFLPRFSSSQEVQLTIEMKTSMLKNKIKKVSKYQQSPEILIPVELKISKGDNISYKYDGGIQKDYYTEESNSQGETCYKFFIKNNPELKPNIKFLFEPKDIGEVQIDVLYGTPEYKMVDSSCDIAQTIKFIEE